jgi:hypothetical protein
MDESTIFGGLMILWGIFMLGMLALMIVIWWKIFEKAGHPGWLGLLMLVPIANIIMILVLAFGEWPVHRELARLRGTAMG